MAGHGSNPGKQVAKVPGMAKILWKLLQAVAYTGRAAWRTALPDGLVRVNGRARDGIAAEVIQPS